MADTSWDLSLPKHCLQPLRCLHHQRVLITGGCGFLGKHITHQLLQIGAHVTVFDIAPNAYTDTVDAAGKQVVRYVKGDLCNREQVVSVLAKHDIVFHVASPAATTLNYKLLYAVNVDGTANVVEACVKWGIKLVYTSTASIVFDGTDQKYFDETCDTKPVGHYAKVQ